MPALPVAALLTPIADDAPAGPDLEYDADFMALERAALGTPEREIGQVREPASPPRWPEVLEQALALSQRSRDLRLAVLLTRAGARTAGLAGAADGLQLLAGLLGRYWDTVHPMLDASDGHDATLRLNTLWPLGQFDTGLADLRAAAIGPPALGLALRTVELAWARVEPLGGESRPDPAGVLEHLRAAQAAEPGTQATLMAFDAACRELVSILEARAPAQGPDLKPLLRLGAACGQAASALAAVERPATDDAAPGAIVEVARATARAAGDTRLRSREDVLRLLDTACQWIELNEPSNPAPLLIRRAQRLMSKSFVELVRDLAPGGLGELERIAGLEST